MLELGEMLISVPKIWGFGAAILTAVAVYWFLQKTRMGRAVRATSLDRDAASLMGINQYKIYNIAFGIGSAAAGIAGVVLVPFYNVFPTVGVLFDIKGFIIVVLGGLGSISGAILGGIIVGVIESVAPQFMTATWTEAIVYGLFLAVLSSSPPACSASSTTGRQTLRIWNRAEHQYHVPYRACLAITLPVACHWWSGAPHTCTYSLLLFLYAYLTSSWNLVGGFAGVLPLGHAAFVGIGAYTSTSFFCSAG
jgi:ABC-type branched-subunit amino acid transport system permease subunit